MSKKHKQKHHVNGSTDAGSLVPKDRILYWAYGSNLNVRQMARRCPKATKFGPMMVKDCALVFRGVADVTMRDGYNTPGGLWTITTDCERALDQYEGVASKLYLKRYFSPTLDDGKKYTCLFYQMRAKDGIMPPTAEYMGTIVQGYKDFGLDTAPLQAALEESWHSKDITEQMLERAIRRGSVPLAKGLDDLPVRHEARALLPAPMWNDENDMGLAKRRQP